MLDDHRRRYALPLPLRFGLIGAAEGFAAVLVIELITTRLSLSSLVVIEALLAAGLAAVIGGMVGVGAGYLRQQRYVRLTNVADAWLRGNLALRVGDTKADELGYLAQRLDLVVEHLEEDEQDLERLRESNVRLTDQVRALAVVEERNRLARELHDSVKQHLFSLALTASAVRARLDLLRSQGQPVEPELAEMVREIEAAAQHAQRETTRLIEDLRPAPLQERGLAAALNDYTLLFGAQHHLLVYLDVRCDQMALSPLATETLYRVAQEALHNVARHAHASRVDVGLLCSAHRVTLMIEDNGIGFDTRHTRRGLGISSMQERLLAVGGRLQIESEPGAGTTIRAEVDMTDRASSPSRTPASAAAPEAQQSPEVWGWLGQKLTIPVGQTWPWPPADQARHLRGPQVAPGELQLRGERRFLGLRQRYVLWSRDHHAPLVHLSPERGRIAWDAGDAHWSLRHISGGPGRAILERNDQPMAALQHRGHETGSHTDIIYDDRTYTLTTSAEDQESFVLTDAASGETLVTFEGAHVQVDHRLPLPLIVMVAARVIDETPTRSAAREPHAPSSNASGSEGRTETDRELRQALRSELRTLVRDVQAGSSADVASRVETLAHTLLSILPRVPHLSGSHHDAYTIRQTIRDYLPTALADYRALPADFAVGEPIQDGKTAREHLLHQLDLLQQAVDDIAARLPREEAQNLLSHGRFLVKKFGDQVSDRSRKGDSDAQHGSLSDEDV